jgi:hypothetical protein
MRAAFCEWVLSFLHPALSTKLERIERSQTEIIRDLREIRYRTDRLDQLVRSMRAPQPHEWQRRVVR